MTPTVDLFYVSGNAHFSSTSVDLARDSAERYADDLPDIINGVPQTITLNELGRNDFGEFVISVAVYPTQ